MSIINTIKNKFVAGCVAVSEFKNNQQGVTAVEYAVVIAGVTAVVMVIFGNGGAVQSMLNNVFTTISDKVTSTVSA